MKKQTKKLLTTTILVIVIAGIGTTFTILFSNLFEGLYGLETGTPGTLSDMIDHGWSEISWPTIVVGCICIVVVYVTFFFLKIPMRNYRQKTQS